MIAAKAVGFKDVTVVTTNDDQRKAEAHLSKFKNTTACPQLETPEGCLTESVAIAKYFSLKWLGVPVGKMRLTYVKAVELNQAHMVLTYYASIDQEPMVLDNLVNDILPASQRSDLVPVYSFNGDGLWKAKLKGGDSRLGDADDITLWKELRARIEHE